jgi:hypothetical protein
LPNVGVRKSFAAQLLCELFLLCVSHVAAAL